jgi:hypothetical protein
MKALTAFILVSLLSSTGSNSQSVLSPRNLTGKFNSIGRVISLEWGVTDSTNAGYNLFVKRGVEEKFLLWGRAGLIGSNNYDFEVISRLGEFYEFKVCAVHNFPEVIRSEYSNTVIVEVSTGFLPMVRINQPITKNKIVEITWEYNVSAVDLMGFILYLDNEEILLPILSRNYIAANLSSGKHFVQISAFTSSGVKSEPTHKKIISVR